MNSTAIQAAARRVASAEHAHEQAKCHEAAAAENCADLDARTAVLQKRREKAREDLASGVITEIQAAGLVGLLDADIFDLAGLQRSARERLVQATEAANEAAATHAAAAADLAQTEAAARFAAVSSYAAELDKLLCDAVADLATLAHQTGRSGNSLSGVFMPSQSLTAMISFRQIPRKAAA